MWDEYMADRPGCDTGLEMHEITGQQEMTGLYGTKVSTINMQGQVQGGMVGLDGSD